MNSTKKFTIEEFEKIDDVVYSKSAQGARDKAYNLASLWTDGMFSIPDVSEFESIIKRRDEE